MSDAQAPEVFLTPRVIDKAAFDELSGTLARLIQQASGEGASLRNALMEVKGLDHTARRAAGELANRLDAAARIVPSIDERVQRAEAVLQAASEHAIASQTVERQIDEIIQRRLGGVEARAAEVARLIDQRLSSMQEHAEQAGAAFERALAERLSQAESDERTRQVIEATQRAEVVLRELEARLVRADGDVAQRLDAGLASIEARAARASEELQTLDERTAQLSTRARQEIDRAGSALDERLTRLSAALEQRVSQVAGELGAQTGPAITSLSLLCHRAVDILGRDPRLAPDAPGAPAPRAGSLGELVQRAERATEQAAAAARQGESLREQANQVQSSLRDAILQGAEWADGLLARQERARRALGDVEKACAGAELLMARHAEAMRETEPDGLTARAAMVDALLARVAQAREAARETGLDASACELRGEALGARVRELAAGIELIEHRAREVAGGAAREADEARRRLESQMASIEARAQAVAAHLEPGVGRAEKAQASAARAAAEVREVLGALRTAQNDLEPWRSVLMPRDGEPVSLPGALGEVVAAFRDRLEREVGRAAALIMECEKRLGEIGVASEAAAPTKPAARSRTQRPRRAKSAPAPAPPAPEAEGRASETKTPSKGRGKTPRPSRER